MSISARGSSVGGAGGRSIPTPVHPGPGSHRSQTQRSRDFAWLELLGEREEPRSLSLVFASIGMLQKDYPALFQLGNRQLRFSVSSLFNWLRQSNMAIHPCTARWLSETRRFSTARHLLIGLEISKLRVDHQMPQATGASSSEPGGIDSVLVWNRHPVLPTRSGGCGDRSKARTPARMPELPPGVILAEASPERRTGVRFNAAGDAAGRQGCSTHRLSRTVLARLAVTGMAVFGERFSETWRIGRDPSLTQCCSNGSDRVCGARLAGRHDEPCCGNP